MNHSTAPMTVTLEAERVLYRRADLADRLALCGRLIAATGKPALREPINVRFGIAVLDRYRDGESLLREWSRVREQPLSRLAAWLSPAKEESGHAYPSEFAAA